METGEHPAPLGEVVLQGPGQWHGAVDNVIPELAQLFRDKPSGLGRFSVAWPGAGGRCPNCPWWPQLAEALPAPLRPGAGQWALCEKRPPESGSETLPG